MNVREKKGRGEGRRGRENMVMKKTKKEERLTEEHIKSLCLISQKINQR